MSFPFFRWFPTDYVAATLHLGMTQDCVYRRLIDAYMMRGGPLPADLNRLCALARAMTPEEKAAVEFVLGEFFTLDSTAEGTRVFRSKRCDHELQHRNEKSEKARASVAAREQARMAREASRRAEEAINSAQMTPNDAIEGSSNDDRTMIERSSTQTQTQRKSKATPLSAEKPADAPAGFLKFWRAYPHYGGRSSRAKALALWRGMKLEPLADRVAGAVEFCRGTADWTKDGGAFVPGAQVWLRDRLWEQEIAAPATTAGLFGGRRWD